MQTLNDIGWNDTLSRSWEDLGLEHCRPARVIADFGTMLKVAMPEERKAEVSGRLVYLSDPADLPKVGDWVAVQIIDDETGQIEAVLPRASEISRKAAGERVAKQVLAANIDVAFIVQAFDDDFSPERLERYLYQLKSDNIQPVLVLNKIDKAEDPAAYIAKIRSIGIPFITCSAKTGDGVDEMLAFLKPGQTAVLLGSSGVGKSTLTNHLLGREVQKTQAIRDVDGKGRHTTVHRELFRLENGSLLIDTPGVRELQLWGTEEGLQDTFDDITALAQQCQFRNCRHTTEPGCAINQARRDGSLSAARYNNYLKMKRELTHLETRTDPTVLRDKKKAISKFLKQHYRDAKRDEGLA